MVNELSTLQAIIKRAAHIHPDKGVTHIDKEGMITSFQSYANILSDAEKVLNGLRKAGVQPGSSVVLQLNSNADLIVAFWGCILGGFLPTPVSYFSEYSGSTAELDKFMNIWEFLDKPIIIMDDVSKEILKNRLKQTLLSKLSIVTIQELVANSNAHDWHVSASNDIVLNLLTSGSTGIPKCVQHTHVSIIARAIAMNKIMKFTSNEVSLNWMPMDHIGGLVMFHVHDTYLACQQVNAKIEMFLANPINWILWMSKYRITMTWAPNFAFSLLNKYESEIQKLSSDVNLSSVRFILNGGEMVSVKDVQSFLRILTPLGLPKNAVHPSYGMSETSSGVTLSNIVYGKKQGIRVVAKHSINSTLQYMDNIEDDSLTYAEVGQPIPGVDFRVVDQENHSFPEDQIGHVQVKGSVLMHGYYKNPNANKEVFLEDSWFKTGDLGFLHKGRVTITGREKDIIILNGANYMNHEVENIIEKNVLGIEKTFVAACGITTQDNGRERLVIFFVPSATQFRDQISIIRAIKETIHRNLGTSVDLAVPIEKHSFPKTNSGKIQRKQLATRFLAGEFQEIIDKIQLYLHNFSSLPNWICEKNWVEKFNQKIKHTKNQKHFLLFSDTSGFCESIEKKLLTENKTVFVVKKGKKFRVINKNSYEIDITKKEDYTRLLSDIKEKVDNLSIINFMYYDSQLFSDELEEMSQQQLCNVFSFVYLVQALTSLAIHPYGLFIVSSLAQSILLEENFQPQKSIIVGLIKTLIKECPKWNIKHIDFPLSNKIFPVDYLFDEFYCTESSYEVVYRDNKRFISEMRIINKTEIDVQKETFKKDGFYLIVGGLGGIGYQIAKYLLEYYHARILIVGKTDLENNKEKKVLFEKLLKKGIVNYVSLDVIQENELLMLVKKTEDQYKCMLNGAIHLANLGLEDNFSHPEKHLIKNETLEYGHDMFSVKCLGAYVLSKLLKKYNEATFICFSSVMSYFPQVAFGMYAAANSFIENFSYYHQALNPKHKVLTISWSEWENIGMSSYNPFKNVSTRVGFDNISVYQGLLSLEACLKLKKTSTYVGLNEKAYGDVEYFSKNKKEQKLNSLKLQSIVWNENASIIKNIEMKLLQIWYEILGSQNIKDDSDFFTCGGSSIEIFRLIELISKSFSVELSVKTIFENSTFIDLCKTLEKELSKYEQSKILSSVA